MNDEERLVHELQGVLLSSVTSTALHNPRGMTIDDVIHILAGAPAWKAEENAP